MASAACRKRQAAVAARLGQAGIAAAVFLDDEAHRDPGLRWLCGQPGDGVLVITAGGRSVLAAWDAILASRMACADAVLPYTEFGRSLPEFLSRILPELEVPAGAPLEISPLTFWVEHAHLSEELPAWELRCPKGGAHALVKELRAVKDEEELAIFRRACSITDLLLEELRGGISSGAIETEADAALLVERRCRELGAEGTGFETLAAGPARSWGIHAFPAWGAGVFGGRGLSILDFGVRLEGYCTDVTLGVARGPLDTTQGLMVDLVREASRAAATAARPGLSAREPARACAEVFQAAGWVMPHALGHGIGLEAHERPFLRDREDNDALLMPGMVFTLEPGLYHPEAGGIRLEDDWLMTEKGPERLTSSSILVL